MKIEKSSRHSKIIGNCGENLLCNWFSRYGFETTLIDHAGIDVVAYHPETKRRLGVSVKSRTRVEGREEAHVNIFRREKGDRKKILDACAASGCTPWIGVYVEAANCADIYLVALDHFDRHYRGRENRSVEVWKMTEKYRKIYAADPEVRHIHMEFIVNSWDWTKDSDSCQPRV